MAFDFGNANDQQKEAIQTTEGPLLIIAGPGTGKTFTLVKRIVYLITERGIQPEEIMVATFTEKAAKELITRITNELYKMGVQVNLNEMYVGTFHSICLRVIKEHFWDRGNWQPLCEHHHNVKTMTEDRYVEYKF